MSMILPSWNEGKTKQSIIDFVNRVTTKGGKEYVPPEDRVAVFDNDGTLWSEKPMPVELIYILKHLAAAAENDSSLRDKQPYQAAFNKDYKWLGEVITKHYQGDDSDVKVLLGGILKSFSGMTIDAYSTDAGDFLHQSKHPTLGRLLKECTYLPMIELMRYLESNGFTVFIASGGDRDFIRVISQEIYSIPPERVVGSSNALRYEENDNGGSIVYKAEPDVFDDGPAKPVRIWSRIGRRPILAAGNSNGDIEMIKFSVNQSHPSLGLLVNHDDKEREFDYRAGAERSLGLASQLGWTVISMKDDWDTVFGDEMVRNKNTTMSAQL